ncbi:CPBP family intramembrane metalloprotease, partial [Burkholderia multivorans]
MDDVTDETAEQRWSVVSLPGLSAVLIAVSAVILFGIGTDLPEIKAWGYAPMLA